MLYTIWLDILHRLLWHSVVWKFWYKISVLQRTLSGVLRSASKHVSALQTSLHSGLQRLVLQVRQVTWRTLLETIHNSKNNLNLYIFQNKSRKLLKYRGLEDGVGPFNSESRRHIIAIFLRVWCMTGSITKAQIYIHFSCLPHVIKLTFWQQEISWI
jgi:hypothetical protein